MISEAFCSRQILRLRVLKNPPDEYGQEEIIKALQRHALSEDHAIRIIDKWSQSNRFWPVPLDIEELATALPVSDIKTKPDDSCPACCGSGFEEVYTLVTHERIGDSHYKRVEKFEGREKYEELRRLVDGQKQIVYTHARRCTLCGYGKALQQAEEARNPKAKAADIPDLDESRHHFDPPPPKPAKAALKKKTPVEISKQPTWAFKPITAEDFDERLRKELEKGQVTDGYPD